MGVFGETKVHLENLVVMVWMEFQESLVEKEKTVIVVTKEKRGLQENQVHQNLVATRMKKEIQETEEIKVKLGVTARRESQVDVVPKERQVDADLMAWKV